MSKISLAIHGGAGTILKAQMTLTKEKAFTKALQKALTGGFNILKNGGNALLAVETAVTILENSPLFNAGRGSVFTAAGTHEMDAAIMDGKTLNAGAVAMVKNIKNPIVLARKIMENSGHVLLAGSGAETFAKEQKVEFEKAEYFFDDFRFNQWQDAKKLNTVFLDHTVKTDEKFGTVGAVALDEFGNLAAATSTGGMTNKKFGRIGDSPIIGSGTYANNQTCAISCTGSGEFFLRSVVAYDVSCLMEYKGLNLTDACREVIQKKLPKIGGDGGLIAIDNKGNIALEFNTEGMYRGFKNLKTQEVLIYK